jgi:hypothetical protein
MFNPTTPVVGAAVSGLTSPTYTLTADLAPSPHGKQFAVTALGGTQANVSSHSLSQPFVASMFRPANPKVLSIVNPVTGQLQSVPRNVFKLIVVKGVVPLSGQAPVNAVVRTEIHVPAGADTADTNSLSAMISCAGGILWAEADGIASTALTNVL